MNGISIHTKYVRTLYSECYIEKKEGGWRLMSGRCRQSNRVLNLVHHPRPRSCVALETPQRAWFVYGSRSQESGA